MSILIETLGWKHWQVWIIPLDEDDHGDDTIATRTVSADLILTEKELEFVTLLDVDDDFDFFVTIMIMNGWK